MTASPHTIGADQSLGTAHTLMRTHRVRHLPVLEAGKLVGILTQRDLYYLETIDGVDEKADRVADAMTPDVYTAGPNDSLRSIARAMAARKYGCAVIVDGDKVIGIFTANDALRYLSTMDARF